MATATNKVDPFTPVALTMRDVSERELVSA